MRHPSHGASNLSEGYNQLSYKSHRISKGMVLEENKGRREDKEMSRVVYYWISWNPTLILNRPANRQICRHLRYLSEGQNRRFVLLTCS